MIHAVEEGGSMPMHCTAVIAMAASERQADAIIHELTMTGSPKHTISAIFPDQRSGRDFMSRQHLLEPPPTIPGMSSGGLLGGALGGWLVGGALGWLVGLGALELTVADGLTAASSNIAMLGVATISATIGGLVGAWFCIRAKKASAHRYEKRIHSGFILMLVHTEVDVEIQRVMAIFARYGATSIAFIGDSYVVTG